MKVFIIAAVSADGFIARSSDELADWTSKEDKKLFVTLTKQAGVLTMGRNTYETIGRALPDRRNIIYTRRPVDADGVETTQESPKDLIKRLEQEGYTELAVCGGREIYDLFLKEGVVDEIYLSVEPVLFGSGIPLAKTMKDTQLALLESTQLNSHTVLLHYKVVH